uniref:Uncharacterized protein n=1 Tax=Anguilla anguilla TaxID=7936 RepID=A0A0E9Q3A5_ANGAN
MGKGFQSAAELRVPTVIGLSFPHLASAISSILIAAVLGPVCLLTVCEKPNIEIIVPHHSKAQHGTCTITK